jgi:hypothetical protein
MEVVDVAAVRVVEQLAVVVASDEVDIDEPLNLSP